MSPAGLAAMRIAATLAHVLPSLRVRIRHGDRTLLEVAAHPAGTSGAAIGACAFRRAVAAAHEQSKRGIRLAFKGLPIGDEPAIDIGVRAGDATLPGGVYRVTLGVETVHGFATTLSPRDCRAALAALPEGVRPVRLHRDAATEVTFVHTVSPMADAPADATHLTPVLEALLADEVVRELAGCG